MEMEMGRQEMEGRKGSGRERGEEGEERRVRVVERAKKEMKIEGRIREDIYNRA